MGDVGFPSTETWARPAIFRHLFELQNSYRARFCLSASVCECTTWGREKKESRVSSRKTRDALSGVENSQGTLHTIWQTDSSTPLHSHPPFWCLAIGLSQVPSSQQPTPLHESSSARCEEQPSPNPLHVIPMHFYLTRKSDGSSWK